MDCICPFLTFYLLQANTKNLIQTGKKRDFFDYDFIVLACIESVALSVRIRAAMISGPLD